ncbi:hypothetical protein [Methyloglobulus sp.]|uniref:hypothetical protein n=1 Tax=Methyloglobulus sp. TaxID=2518622 RepID=UPI0032B73FB3
MLKNLYRKATNALLTVLVFIYLVLEEIVWDRIAAPIYGFIRELKILHKLEAVILKLNRYALLVCFLVLFAAVELLGIIAIGLFAQGQVLIATVIYVGKIPIAAFTFWVFQIAKDKLLTFAWFKLCYEWLLAQLHKIKTSVIYVNIKAKISSMKMWFKSLISSESIRRIKAVLGFKLS